MKPFLTDTSRGTRPALAQAEWPEATGRALRDWRGLGFGAITLLGIWAMLLVTPN